MLTITRQLLFAYVLSFFAFFAQAEDTATKVMIFGGGNAHNFKSDVQSFIQFLQDEKKYEVSYTEDIAQLDYEALRHFDVLILHCCRNHPDNPEPTPDFLKESLIKFNQEGKGIIFMHCAVASFFDWKDYIDLTGGIWVWQQSQHDPYQMMKSAVIKTDHPVTQGLPEEFEWKDEFYHTLKLLPSSQVLIEGTHVKNNETVKEPLVWIAKDTDKERRMTVIYGHDQEAWNHPVFRKLMVNSMEWVGFQR